MSYELVPIDFKDVVIGSVFYDPEQGARFQKVDQPIDDDMNKHRQEFNAVGQTGRFNFKRDRLVQTPKFV